MSKMTVLGMRGDREAVLNTLMKLGAVEIIPRKEEEEQPPSGASARSCVIHVDTRNRLQRAIAVMERRFPKKRPMFAGKPIVSDRAFELSPQEEERILSWLDEFEAAQEKENSLRSTIAGLNQRADELEPWADVPLDLSVEETIRTEIMYGTIRDEKVFEELKEEIDRDMSTTTFLPVGETDNHSLLLVIVAMKENAAHLRQRLSSYEFHALPREVISGTARESLDRTHAKIEALEDERQQQEAILKRIGEERESFMLYHDVLQVRDDKAAAKTELTETDYTFAFRCWVPTERTGEISELLKERFGAAVDHRPAAKDESFPIQLKNGPFSKSFEIVLTMYGAPGSDEADPTPVMAPFYMIIFGMMLSDVGYGLLLLIGCLLMLFKFKVKGNLYQMCRMLTLSAVSSIIWGFVFGGFFGDLITVLSDGTAHFPVLWFDPMESPMKLLVFSMLFGVIHLFFGMGMHIYNEKLRGDLIGGLLDIVPWYAIITGGLLYIVGSMNPLNLAAGTASGLGEAGKWMAIVGAATLLLFAGRGIKNPIKRLVKGLGALYDVTSYFSDILSYSRILALVLATSVIAKVVNELGSSLGGGVIGSLIFILIGIIGHGLNLALSGLSAYVHASRLQYVEMFGKFFGGNGRYWKPLKRNTRYVEISETERDKKVA